MSVFNEDRSRQVVPRWRSFAATVDFKESAPLRIRDAGSFSAQMLKHVLDDWHRQPSLSVAADLVSASFTIGCQQVAREAAEFVLLDRTAPDAARDIALQCLDESEANLDANPNHRTPSETDTPEVLIHRNRERLRIYPNNPVMWANLALLFTTIGQEQKAERAMRSALGLAPENRFIVRAACRFFLHKGDFGRAHMVLLRTAAVKHDPWILAGEIAVSAVRNRTSQFIKTARAMVESQNHSPFHLSELAGALATLEASGGNVKRARRLCQFSLTEPAENAIAQAAWLSRNIGGFSACSLPPESSAKSSEANAWKASNDGQWNQALDEAKQWQAEQPFSSRPASLGSFIASTALEKYGEAEKIIRQSLMSNRDDATLINNLAFVLAKQGKVVEADGVLSQQGPASTNQFQRVCLVATAGLVAFRAGDLARGRSLYRQAISSASTESLKSLAKIYLAIEELRVQSHEAQVALKDATDSAAKLPGVLSNLFREKLRNADRDSIAKSGPPSFVLQQ